MKIKLKKLNKLNAQGSLELVAVVVILFVFVILILDLALFFRQTYVVQTVADEVLSKMKSIGFCYYDADRYNNNGLGNGGLAFSDLAGSAKKYKQAMASTINYYYSTKFDYLNIIPGFEARDQRTGGTRVIPHSETLGKVKSFSQYTSDRKYQFDIVCDNPTTPSSVIFSYNYKGIFMFRNGRRIYSNPSSDTTLF